MTAVLQGASVPLPMQPPPTPYDRKALAHVAELLRVAKKPMLYVGQGANDAVQELTALAELTNVPVTTTLHAMGVFSEHHPLSMHMLGMHGAAYANYAIQASDLIIAVGSRFDDRTTGLLGKYAPVAKAAAEEGRGGSAGTERPLPWLSTSHAPCACPVAPGAQAASTASEAHLEQLGGLARLAERASADLRMIHFSHPQAASSTSTSSRASSDA